MSGVVELGARRRGAGIVAQSREPLHLAELYLHHRRSRGDLRRWRETWWCWAGSAYRALGDEHLVADLYTFLEQVSVLEQEGEGRERLEPVAPRKRLVAEVVAALPSRGILVDGKAPLWLEAEGEHSPRDLLPVANGLLHLPSATLLPATPNYFAVAASPVAWAPRAPEPERWLRFLAELWGDDRESIDTLGEIFGYLLSTDTRQQKTFLVVGPKRSGKGTIARTLSAIVGPDHVASPTLAALATNFGLAPLLDRPVAIVADARLSGRADQAVIAERLLSISGEDLQTIDRKYLPAVTCRLPTRFVIMSNELPRLADVSGALASRFVVLVLERSFFGEEDHDLGDTLAAELPGILRWAVQGYQRLRERGRFCQPASGAEAVRELEELGSPVGAFIAERCVVGAGLTVSRDALYAAWRAWCDERGRAQPGTEATFGRDVRAVVPAIRDTRPRVAGERRRCYEGIGLVSTNAQGELA